MRTVSGKIFREKHEVYFYVRQLLSENLAIYDTIRGKKDEARQVTDDNTILRRRITCLIIKARHTHSDYVTFIAFPLQKKSLMVLLYFQKFSEFFLSVKKKCGETLYIRAYTLSDVKQQRHCSKFHSDSNTSYRLQ